MFVMISVFERIFSIFACCKMLVDFICFDLKYIILYTQYLLP